jgi:hypothetical protein
MAAPLFRFNAGPRIHRGGGLKAAAYLGRCRYQDERTGEVYDFRYKSEIQEEARHLQKLGEYGTTSRQEVLHLGMYAPANAPEWMRGKENIARVVNAAEHAEMRHDAQVAERFNVALPYMFNVQQARWAIEDHIREFIRQGRVVIAAIHSPEPDGDQRNLHGHLIVFNRGVDENGFKKTKAVEQQARFMRKREYIDGLRENWANTLNRHLARHGYEANLDHRSYQRRGIDREPQIHLLPGDWVKEKRGERTPGGDYNRAVRERNLEREALRRARDLLKTVDQAHAQRHTEPQDAQQTPEASDPAPGRPPLGLIIYSWWLKLMS